MGLQVNKRLRLEQPMGIDLNSTDTCPIKATKLALVTIRANEIAIENSKTGKVTAVVAILKIFRDQSKSHNSKLLIKPNKWLNLKKKDLNWSNKHLNGLSKPISNVSKRLIVKQKNYKGIAWHRIEWWPPFHQRRVSKVHTDCEEGCVTIVGHFQWHLSSKKGGYDWHLLNGVFC
jgi:hypothetical protein